MNPKILPVFHFHEVTPSYLRPFLEHLSKNGYRTGSVEDILEVAKNGKEPSPKTVVLTFDDAWSSLWTVAAPLLEELGMQAITFAIPGRVSTQPGVRDTIRNRPELTDLGDAGEEPFCRWDELRQLDKGNVISVESHTFAHEQIPVSKEATGIWTAEDCERVSLLSRPLVWSGEESFRPYDEREIGSPKLITHARMSDVPAFRGEAAENAAEQRAAIQKDLVQCREVFEKELGRPTRLLCFPWTIGGKVAREEAAVVGYEAAFADSFPGKRYVHKASSPFRLMRLKHEWILKLPG